MSQALIQSFLTDIICVKRFGVGSYHNGEYIPGKSKKFDVEASVQPLSPNEVLRLSENQRTKQAIKLYTVVELYTTDERKLRKADLVEHKGRLFEVTGVEFWEKDLTHYKIIAIKVDGEGNGNN